MPLALLIIATMLSISFIIQLIRGRKYDEELKLLVGDEYTLSEVYGVGFEWEEIIPALSPAGELGQNLGKEMSLLYGNAERDFYVAVTIAKAITFVHLGAAFSFVLGAILFTDMTGLIIALGGTIASVVLAYMVLNEPKNKNQSNTDELTIEIPNMVTKLSLLLGTGMTLNQAWQVVAEQTEGFLGDLMKESCSEVKNGIHIVNALYNMGNRTDSKDIKRLISFLTQGIERSGADLAFILADQATELWSAKRQRMLQKGEEAAAKLLIPTMLMFIGLILVIVVASMGGVSI